VKNEHYRPTHVDRAMVLRYMADEWERNDSNDQLPWAILGGLSASGFLRLLAEEEEWANANE
jgi:hypothetical protein